MLKPLSYLQLIILVHTFLFGDEIGYEYKATGYVRDINYNTPVSGVTINFSVQYMEFSGQDFPWPEVSVEATTGANGYYDAHFDIAGEYTWVVKKIYISDYPANVLIEFSGSEAYAPRFYYNSNVIPEPPHLNWTSTDWYVWDTESSGEPPELPDPNDNDYDGIDDDYELFIANKFSPILHKHSYDEQEDIANLDELIQGSYGNLKGKALLGDEFYNSSLPPIHVTATPSGGNQIRYDSYGMYPDPNYQGFWKINLENSIRHNGASIGSRPIYFHVYDDGIYYYIQYWYFFSMNDIRDQTLNNTWHEGDWEHVALKLQKSGDIIEPIAVNFYQHYGGYTRTPDVCWWSSTNSLTYDGIQQGYDESYTHLNIWIAANAHASYNRYDPVYYLYADLQAGISIHEEYIDNVDYDPSGYDLYFPYDYLDKMGGASSCTYCEYHDITWYWHNYPVGNSKEWLAFTGRIGDYWTGPGTATYSPYSPSIDVYWLFFTENYSGFGNELGFFDDIVAEIFWVDDPPEGDEPEPMPPPKGREF